MKNKLKVRSTCLIFSILAIINVACEDYKNKSGLDSKDLYLKGQLTDVSTLGETVDVEITKRTTELEFTFNLEKAADRDIIMLVEIDCNLLNYYNESQGKSLIVFPPTHSSLSGNGELRIESGKNKSNKLTVTLNCYGVEDGKYLLPISVNAKSWGLELTSKYLFYEITVNQMTKGSDIASICYVETNSANPLNVGSYTLANSRIPFFDIAILFASNIHYDAETDMPALHLNPNVKHLLENREIYIKPLQDMGIKVSMSVLGNWQGIGFSNMTDQQIEHFVKQCKDVVQKYEIDGVDFDDEYADYNNQYSLPSRNATSYAKMLVAMREAMPDKLITVYYISTNKGTNNDYTSVHGFKDLVDGIKVGEVVDYMYWPFYGSYFSVLEEETCPAGITKKQWGPAPFWINSNSPNAETAKQYSQRIVDDGFGVNLIYDLRDGNYTDYFTGISEIIYGEATEKTGKSYSKDW